MIIKFAKVENGYRGTTAWNCTNCVSGHEISIYQDMLGDYIAIVEKQLEDGSFESYEEVFDSLEPAMRWCECPTEDNPVCLSTSFGA